MPRHALPVISDCSDCGACCHGQEALPVCILQPGYLPAGVTLPAALRIELLADVREFERNGWPINEPCIWFDAALKRCRHYEHRPTICRDNLQAGDDTCRRIRRIEGIDDRVVYRQNGRGHMVRVVIPGSKKP